MEDGAAALHAAKLRALTRDRVGASARPGAFPGGAALTDGDDAWVLLREEWDTRLGGALAWARRQGRARVHVVVDDAASAAALARRAAWFDPAPEVWSVAGTSLVAADPAPAPAPAPPPEAPDLAAVLADAGLDVIPGDGALLGEVRGLEVARVEAGPDGPELQVGVGRFDREVGDMTHAHLDPRARVRRVVEIVEPLRRAEAPRHPLNQLVPERWLRSVVVSRPDLVGARRLTPVPSVGERASLLAAGVASAVGTDSEGDPVVVTCSTGVDLELVPAAADDRALHAPAARLVLAVPERDAVALTRELAAALVAPAVVVGVPDTWRSLA